MPRAEVAPASNPHAQEVARGERFEFGKNWARFLTLLNERRIATAEHSLREWLETDSLEGKSFLDIGSGSGLFSLAARRLGARVHSFDYDPHSVACTSELRRRYFPGDESWVVESGSALDADYCARLGLFDVVYSWGVLHHTGEMWKGLEHASRLVAPGGRLFIAIYNDQGTPSRRWKKVKQMYNRLPAGLRFLVLWPSAAHLYWHRVVKNALHGKPLEAFREYGPENVRGMSLWSDLVDWVGGYPFEVATPEQIFDFYRARGFTLTRLETQGGSLGCNQFVFAKHECPAGH